MTVKAPIYRASTDDVGAALCREGLRSSPGILWKNREFSHIVSGACTFTPDGGEPVELRAGDAVLFPENCEGVWNIHEALRKTYVLF